MDAQDKQTIFTSLRKCEGHVAANLEVVGQPQEAELRSINNEKLAAELLDFSTHVADVIQMTQEQKDFVEQLYEQKKLDEMKADIPANKAESLVKVDLSYISELNKLRDLQHSERVLKRKESSLNTILDQSRSRLSLVSKGLPT